VHPTAHWESSIIKLYSYTGILTLLLLLASSCYGFTQPQHQKNSQLLQFQLQQSTRSPTFRQAFPKNDSSYCLCPDDDDAIEGDDLLLEDRREALFAMMGSLWAAGALPTTFLFPAEAANTAFGDDAKILLPDVVQGLLDRYNKPCLIESLGNCECLVYQGDKDKLLYKGADASILLGRTQTASQAMEMEVPPLVETKQSNQITGVLSGPMGQLSSTLTMLCGLAEKPGDAKQKAQIVKQGHGDNQQARRPSIEVWLTFLHHYNIYIIII
jgi:hypothetical protein